MTVTNLKVRGPDDSINTGLQTRVFVGLRIAPQIAALLAQMIVDLRNPLLRPVAGGDIHLTLVPPWNECSTGVAIDRLARVADDFAAFLLAFQHIGYGPQPRRPRLVWVDCAASEEITALHAALLHAYGRTDERPFQPHVTLARIRVDRPSIIREYPIDQQLSLTQRIKSLELFQSPPPGEANYRILASVRLGKTAGPTSTP